MTKIIIFFLSLQLLISFSCKRVSEPLQIDDYLSSNIIPLHEDNTWDYISLIDSTKLRNNIVEKKNIIGQEVYLLKHKEFSVKYEKLFYIGNDLFTFYPDSNEYLLFSHDAEKGNIVFGGRYFFLDNKDVITPAGRFTCIIIVQTMRVGMNTYHFEWSIKQGIGVVKYVKTYNQKVISSYELTAYHIFNI